jgi:hypothetical protein
MRDLTGVDLCPADEFPMDDIGYGFDNIGDVLSLPPVLLEKYFAAAGKVLDAAIVTGSARRLRATAGSSSSSPSRQRRKPGWPAPARSSGIRASPTGVLSVRMKSRACSGSTQWRSATERELRGQRETGPTRRARLAALPLPGGVAARAGNREAIHRLVNSRWRRGSYFLWSTMPDEELFHLAERGALRPRLGRRCGGCSPIREPRR